MLLTDYSQNKIMDAWYRGQALGAPATRYAALFTCSKGVRASSTAYAANDTIVVQLSANKYQLYKCTTAGTTATTQPAYTGAISEAITDGNAVFTEQSAVLDTGTIVEVSTSGTGYARPSIASSLAAWAGTQGAGTSVASNGSNGTTSPNASLAFPAPTAQWHPSGGMIAGVMFFDAATGGNATEWFMLTAPKNVNNGDPAPTLPAGAPVFQIGT